MKKDNSRVILSREQYQSHKIRIELIQDQYKFLMYAGNFILNGKSEHVTENELNGFYLLCEHVDALIGSLRDDLEEGAQYE